MTIQRVKVVYYCEECGYVGVDKKPTCPHCGCKVYEEMYLVRLSDVYELE